MATIMATIKTIDVKGWVDKGSPVYSISVGIEYDWMPMTPDQMDAVKLHAEQLKGLIENQLMTWNGGAPAGEFKTADRITKMDSLDSMLVTQLLERVEKLEKLALDNKRSSIEVGTPAKGGNFHYYFDPFAPSSVNDAGLQEIKRIFESAGGKTL